VDFEDFPLGIFFSSFPFIFSFIPFQMEDPQTVFFPGDTC